MASTAIRYGAQLAKHMYKRSGRKQYTRRKRNIAKRRAKGRVAVSTKSIRYLPKSSSLSPLPQCYHTRFTQENSYYSNSGSGVLTGEFVANGLYVPFRSNHWFTSGNLLPNPKLQVTTQSPTGLAYLLPSNAAGPYTSYTVMSSFIKVIVRTTNVADNVTAVVIPFFKDYGFDISTQSAEAVAQRPEARSVMNITDNKGGILKSRVDFARFLGVSKRSYKDDLSGNYDGTYNSNPAKIIGWALRIESMNGNDFIGRVTVDVKITYNTCLWNNYNTVYPGSQNSVPAPDPGDQTAEYTGDGFIP